MITLTKKPFTKQFRELFLNKYCIFYDDKVIIRRPEDLQSCVIVKRIDYKLFCFDTGEYVGEILGDFPEDLEEGTFDDRTR